MINSKLALSLLASSLLFSCNKEEVRVYTEPVPKPKVQKMPSMGGSMPSMGGSQKSQPNPYNFTLPATWTESQGDAMRLLSFSTPDGVDVSVLKIPGSAGTIDANLTRWAAQIGIDLTSTKLEELKNKAVQITRPDQINGFVYDYTPLAVSGKSIIAGIYTETNGVLFVKASGTDVAIAKENSTFIAFNKSLSLKGK
jgi:hypothetical protein